MKKRQKLYGVILSLVSFFLLLSIHSAFGLDELYLSGVVKSIDYRAGEVLVDVQSDSCFGERVFRADDVSLFSGLVGKRISFFINSSSCKGSAVYKIIQFRSEGERR